MYNIYYLGNNESLLEELPFAQQIDSTADINSDAWHWSNIRKSGEVGY